jgi:antitoxin CcdA
MKPVTQTQPVKRPVNLLLNEATVQQARVYTRNLSSTVDGLLAEFVARERQLRLDQQQHYAEVSGAWNRFEEAHGSFADEHSTL